MSIQLYLNDQFDLYLDELVSLINVNIDHALDILDKCISCAAEKIQSKKFKTAKTCEQPDWFDSECSKLKIEKYNRLHAFHSTGLQEDLNTYLESKRIFKNVCHLKKLKYNEKVYN